MHLFNKQILERIGRKLLAEKETIALAESVTAGLLQFAFSTVPDAAKFLHGGITAYNIGQKFKHLRVEPLHALAVNCVSQEVAKEMANNVCTLFSSHWGIGITGYASPVPESGDKVFAYYAISYKSRLKAHGKITAQKVDPTDVQVKFVNYILTQLDKKM